MPNQTPDLTSFRNQIDALAEALNYLAETAHDAGLRAVLIDMSNRASTILDELKSLATSASSGLEATP